MKQHEQKKNGLVIFGLIALILALVVGVRLILNGLSAVMPQREAHSHTALQTDGGQMGPYGMKLLDAQEQQAQDIQNWLEQDEQWLADPSASPENDVFWLYRSDTDEYILYLPGQDRAYSVADVTATEQQDQDGEISLVLRVRTPENSQEVSPEQQLFSIKTNSEQWKGIRVQVILDGRERRVNKLASKENQLYSTEELYIGRF